MAENAGSGHDQIGAVRGGRNHRPLIESAVRFQLDMQFTAENFPLDRRDLGQLIGHEALAAEAGFHCHHQHEIDLLQPREHRFGRRRRFQRDPDRAARLPDRVDHLRGRIGTLQVKGQMVSPRLRERSRVFRRVLDHEMGVGQELALRADGPDHRRPEGEVRYETAVHDVEVDHIGSRLCGAVDLPAETAEVGSQHRRRYQHAVSRQFSQISEHVFFLPESCGGSFPPGCRMLRLPAGSGVGARGKSGLIS